MMTNEISHTNHPISSQGQINVSIGNVMFVVIKANSKDYYQSCKSNVSMRKVCYQRQNKPTLWRRAYNSNKPRTFTRVGLCKKCTRWNISRKITNHDSRTLVHWVCKRGHHWKRSVSYRLHSTSGKCPICQGEMQTSFPEQTLFFYFNKQVECINGYKLKNNSHIDIFIPSRKIGIEYDGPKHISPNKRQETKGRISFCVNWG